MRKLSLISLILSAVILTGSIHAYAFEKPAGGISYGYDYFASEDNGDLKQSFYRKLFDISTELYNDSRDLSEYKGYYIIAKANYAEYDLTKDEAKEIYFTLRNDEPLFYFLSPTVGIEKDELLIISSPKYVSGSERAMLQQMIEDYILEQTGSLQDLPTVYERAEAYYNTLVNSVDFAYNGSKPSSDPEAHNIIGVIKNNSGVCEAYSRTFQMIMNCCGAECLTVAGTAKGDGHAWDILRLDDGEYYCFDPTWDDLLGEREYFADGSEHFSKEHEPYTPDGKGSRFQCELPEISSQAFDYTAYIQNKFSRGDIDLDGSTDVTDMVKLGAHIKGKRLLNKYALSRADLNGDGRTDVTDIVKLAAHLKGLRLLDEYVIE